MRRIFAALLVLMLIGFGAVVDHVVTTTITGPTAASAANTVTTTASTTQSSTASATSQSSSNASTDASAIDAATTSAYKTASASVVYVLSEGVGSGSGVIYDSNGDIVTNDHVVQGATGLKVTLNDGRTYTAHLVGTDSADDLAVIKISAPNLTPAHFASAGQYTPAEAVLAIGSPLGLKQSVTFGLISGLNRVEQEPNGAYIADAIQTSAPINPGNSGGALVTLNGTVVGIPTLVQTSTSDGTTAQDLGFAIPSERVTLIANQIISSGKVTHTDRPYLGIAPSDSSSSGQSSYWGGFGQGSLTPTSGAVVSQIAANGPAAKAGIQQGDVITAIDGTQVTDAQDLLTVLATKKPGDTVTLKVNRNGSTQTVTVKLGELPA